MPQTGDDPISNESPFSSPAPSTSRRPLKNKIWQGICLLSLVGCVLTTVACYRSGPGSTMSDELELVCYFGCAVHSINERLYVSAFREPDWWSNGFPIRIHSDHGWSAGALSLIVMREFGDDSGMFGAAYASLVDEDPPAIRINVAVIMIPYWFAFLICLPCPTVYSVMHIRRRKSRNLPVSDGITKR
jgi:hypothetical protein